MRRIIMLLAAAAFMAMMMVASAAPAMANHLFNNDINDLDNFGVLNDDNDGLFGHNRFGHNRFGVLNDDLFNDGLFNDRNDNEGLDTIRVGDLECLVEDGDDVDFCVNRHTGEIVNV
jgi:hypothetical protein